MGMFLARALVSALFSSFGPFTLGIAAFIATAVYAPGLVRAIQQWSQTVENMVDFEGLPDQAAILVNLVIDDNSITILVFVVGAKFVVALINELLSPSSARHPEQRTDQPT